MDDIRPPKNRRPVTRPTMDGANVREPAPTNTNMTYDDSSVDDLIPEEEIQPITPADNQPPKKEKKSKTGLWITLALIAGFLIGGGAGYYMYQDQASQNDELQTQITDVNNDLQSSKDSAVKAAVEEKDKQIQELEEENADLKKQLEDAQADPDSDTSTEANTTEAEDTTEEAQ